MKLTGDIVQGHSVIEHLDTNQLEPGTHQFWFQPLSMGNGQSWQLPVVVFKGEKDGPRVMITAGIHGDELNGVLTAQQMVRELSDQAVSGTVIVVPMVNISGVLGHSRDFLPTDPDASPTNLNRIFPGNPNGDVANRYVDSIWRNLLSENADITIDLHTQTRGAKYPLYIFADYRIPKTVEMARLMNADCILDDPGDEGVLETVWNRAGVPCITVEVGAGKIQQPEYIARAVKGINNILKAHNVIDGEPQFADIACVEGKEIISIRAEQGGFAIPQVVLGDIVDKGQLLSIQYDSFGNVMAHHIAPKNGYVLSLNQDALREPGTLLVRLLR